MKWTILIFFFWTAPGRVYTQPVFKTMVPQQPVVAGESFQVQYILEGGEKNAVIQPPPFSGCRLISGPNIYQGKNGLNSICNFVYTLEAERSGRLLIPGTTVLSGNATYKSQPLYLDIITRQEAARLQAQKADTPGSEYFLRPGEDPYQKIKENLFVKVEVDKRNCKVGEVVQATFKLYSRLESKSDIIKNPGFYGFTVYDMAGLDAKLTATEKVNGRLFDVHTIRKVQLYPLQAGRFTIDPMEVKNRVEFSRTAVSKKTEQQIAEGMMGMEEEEPAREGTVRYESSSSTETVEVEVRPLPQPARPASFNGAVGHFTIRAITHQPQLAQHEQGFFDIVISGEGNFTQLVAPELQWPAGVEGFEPRVIDALDKSQVPLKGNRIFRYPFVCAAKGKYVLPAQPFSFFDTDSNRYRSLQTEPVQVVITGAAPPAMNKRASGISLEAENEKAAQRAALIAVVLVVLILLYWIIGPQLKKKPVKRQEEPNSGWPAASEWLEPVQRIAPGEDRAFYASLRLAIWDFAAASFKLSGSSMNKQALQAALHEEIADPALSGQLIRVLEICEAGIFTGARLGEDREWLLEQTREVMERIRAGKTG